MFGQFALIRHNSFKFLFRKNRAARHGISVLKQNSYFTLPTLMRYSAI